MNLKVALQAVINELEKAEEKFPSFPTDPIHAATIVSEEAGELARAVLKFTYEDGGWEDIHDEAIQTAAMAIRFLMMMTKMKRRPSKQARRRAEIVGEE